VASLSNVAEFLVRPLAATDIDMAYEIIADWQAQVFGEVEMTRGMFSNLQEIAAAAYVAETADRIVGHAAIRADDINVTVRGSERRRGIGSALLRACEAHVQGDVLGLFGVTLEPSAAPFAAANGYGKAWEVWLMGVDLAGRADTPVWPHEVSVRTFREDEAKAVKDLLDEAYAAEPGHNPLPFEDWKTFMLGDPSYDPSVWFLTLAREEIVGAALNWKEGYVKDLVVHPTWRGRGLGTALMLQTFAEFFARGIPRVTLKTDSINPTQAWRLYERLGMRKERTYEVFEKAC
jgi:ribosomal protein S18 acetylase RimI-like enzyme